MELPQHFLRQLFELKSAKLKSSSVTGGVVLEIAVNGVA